MSAGLDLLFDILDGPCRDPLYHGDRALRLHAIAPRRRLFATPIGVIAAESTRATDKVLNEIKGAGGTVLKTSLDEKKEQHLRDTLENATRPKAA